ncbi:MAG: HK97 gp10 family phage protein [Candidatus Paraimprobicoccus trichonymphae]|uniref:HK97 gp10 family phage protein n=1 Tax=Candidatus Paraimprobicoccus trichonymphae TaxID=3033793 RepID=A0AA48I0B6_9FIRM|nr:MAG: HK97 gp10 family phage protein [Candidatus Paraimprobicoccus trichonymphae]
MASLNFINIDLDKLIPKGLQNDDLAIEMIESGQEIMKNAIQSSANKYRRTGSMANSLKASKPKIDSSGAAVGKVLFTGTDKDGMKNAYKALWLEYGTKNRPATPFVRPAIKTAESTISGAMKKVFDQQLNYEG